MEEMSYLFKKKKMLLVFLFAMVCLFVCLFFFSLSLIFTLLASSISHLHRRYKFFYFFPTKLVSFTFCLSL